jgi:hypothetical protein
MPPIGRFWSSLSTSSETGKQVTTPNHDDAHIPALNA